LTALFLIYHLRLHFFVRKIVTPFYFLNKTNAQPPLNGLLLTIHQTYSNQANLLLSISSYFTLIGTWNCTVF